ncbi:acetyltransferase [Saccharobesus litoralis]|uniref:Acetyltransferase n=1 Tax=Saccharobesus litoralis TaxID=2172099 RepID=A0A2S0VME3_9ALTE|nr:acyltransferase [Saccharobesus litoralis]AWB65366.1 acetyltransferase [Saccharobesus litoralis]
MTTLTLQKAKRWLKASDTPLARHLFNAAKACIHFELPNVRWFYGSLFASHKLVTNSLAALMRIIYWTPLFKSQTLTTGKRLYLYGGLPFMSGGVQVSLGDDCRVSGQTTFSGRVHGEYPAQLIVGDNVDIGWMTTIACGRKVAIGNNVRIAGRAFLAGYPGHPIDAQQRAAGSPETEDQVGDIILEDDVWLATGVSVMAGVTIGKGTIVAAGSVVTKSLPANVLAGGVPAKVIKTL